MASSYKTTASRDSSALSSPELSRENSYALEDGKDGITLPARGGSGGQSKGDTADNATAAGASSSSRLASGNNTSHHHNSNAHRHDWLSPPSTPNPDTSPFFDESEAKRLHMVSRCRHCLQSCQVICRLIVHNKSIYANLPYSNLLKGRL